MKRIIFVTAMVSLLFYNSVFAKNESFKFRGFDWGEDIAWVMVEESFSKLEKHEDYDIYEDYFLLYNVEAGGHNMTAVFKFYRDSLVSGSYNLSEEYESSQGYYEAFADLLSKYKDKYGDPDSYNKEWSETIKDKKVDKNDSDKYGKYIKAGELEITARWNAEDGSFIAMSIYGENREISVVILYFEPDYENDTNGI